MNEATEATKAAEGRKRTVVVVHEANRASQWTDEEAWAVRWEKILAAAE